MAKSTQVHLNRPEEGKVAELHREVALSKRSKESFQIGRQPLHSFLASYLSSSFFDKGKVKMPLPFGLDREIVVRTVAILATFFVVTTVIHPEPLLDLTIGAGSNVDPARSSTGPIATPFSGEGGHSVSFVGKTKDGRNERDFVYINSAQDQSLPVLTGTPLLNGPQDVRYNHRDSELRAREVAVYEAILPVNFVTRWITETLDDFLQTWRTTTFFGMVAVLGGLVARLLRVENKLRKKRTKLAEEYELNLAREKSRLTDEYEARLRDEGIRLNADFESRLEQERRVAERAAWATGEGLTKRIVELQAKYKNGCGSTEIGHQQMLKEQFHSRDEFEEIIEDMDETIRALTAKIEDKDTVISKLQAVFDGQSKEPGRSDTALKSKDETTDDQEATIDKLTKDLDEKNAALKYRINTITSLRKEIADWKDSTLEAYEKLIQTNKLLEQDDSDWSKHVIRLRREVAEMLKENHSLEHELWICSKKIATLEESVVSDRSYFMAALELAYASKRSQPQHDTTKQNIKVDPKLPVPQIEATGDSVKTKGKLETINKHSDASKAVAKYFTDAVPILEAETFKSGSAAGNDSKDQTTVSANDTGLKKNAREIEKAQTVNKLDIYPVSDLTPMDMLALMAEVRSASRSNGVAENKSASSDTVESIKNSDGSNRQPQRTTVNEAAAGDDGRGKTEEVINTQDAKPTHTVDQHGKQIRNRELRSVCALCKSIDLQCDHDKIPCDNCSAEDIDCSREHHKKGEVSSATHDPNKPVKPTKLAIKLKKDCNLPASLEEVQQHLNKSLCPVCIKPGHIAAECPEHPAFGKRNRTMRQGAKQENGESMTAANPEQTSEELPVNPADAGRTSPILQSLPVANGIPRGIPGPLIVGLSDSDGSPTETKKLARNTDTSLRHSKWAGVNSIHTPITHSAIDPQATRLSSRVRSPPESTPIRKGPNPTAPSFTPTTSVPGSAFTPTAPVFTPGQYQPQAQSKSIVQAINIPPSAPRALRNIQNGYNEESSSVSRPPDTQTEQSSVYFRPMLFGGSSPAVYTDNSHRVSCNYPGPSEPGHYTSNSPNRARGWSRGRSETRGRSWGRGQSQILVRQGSIPWQTFAKDAANGIDPDYEALGSNPLIDRVGCSGGSQQQSHDQGQGASANHPPKGEPQS